MKYVAALLCVLFCSAAAAPVETSQYAATDLLKLLEDFVEKEGHLLLTKVVNLIHELEKVVDIVKENIPKVNEKIHEEVDEILAELKKVSADVEEILSKKDVYYGFDILNDLTELTGGTKLRTVLTLLSLAEKTHRVVQDAKEFAPNLEKTLNRIEDKIAKHTTELVNHMIRELSLQEFLAPSVFDKIEDLLENVEEKIHVLILDVLHKIEQTFALIEEKLPEIYDVQKEKIEEIREEIHEILKQIEKSLPINSIQMSSSLWDIAGKLTGGTDLGTAIKVMSVIEKFNTVVQDVRNIEPRAEVLLQHSVKKVASSAQDFLNHAADMLSKF